MTVIEVKDDYHKALKVEAAKREMNLNELTSTIIEEWLEEEASE